LHFGAADEPQQVDLLFALDALYRHDGIHAGSHQDRTLQRLLLRRIVHDLLDQRAVDLDPIAAARNSSKIRLALPISRRRRRQ
jgi:hypothetical protein